MNKYEVWKLFYKEGLLFIAFDLYLKRLNLKGYPDLEQVLEKGVGHMISAVRIDSTKCEHIY